MSEALETAPDPTAFALRFGVAWIFACFTFVGVTWWTWATTTPWDRPVAPLLALSLAWVSVWIGISGRPGTDTTMKITSFAVLAFVTAAIVWAAGTGVLASSRLSATYDELENVAIWTAHGGEIPGSRCRDAPPDLDLGHLGSPDEVCYAAHDGASGPVRQVQFTWNTGRHRSLVFEIGTADPSISQCIQHLEGLWWAWIEDDPNCPPGFDYRGI